MAASASSILSSPFAWKGNSKSSDWISRKASNGFSISFYRKAAIKSSFCISCKEIAGFSNWISQKNADCSTSLFGGCGALLNTITDQVCDDESSSLPSRISPWLMLPPAFEGGDMVYNFYSLAENKVLSLNKRGGGGGGGERESELPDDDAEVVGSSHGWLALFNKGNHDLFLSNPLSRRHIKLPSIHTLPLNEIRLSRDYYVSKLIISCSPDEEECRAMMSFGPANRLAFCTPGRSSEWTPIGDAFLKRETPTFKFARSYEDFVYSNEQKLFNCVASFGLEEWDLCDPRSPRLRWAEGEDEDEKLKYDFGDHTWLGDNLRLVELCTEMNYLVFAEQSNQLFHVIRLVMTRERFVENINDASVRYWDDGYPEKTVGFDVYKVDREGGKRRYMEGSLDGLAMFIGTNHSFAVSAAEFPELKPNSIYFTDAKEITPLDWHTHGGHDIGIYDFENRTFAPFDYPCDVQSIEGNVPAPVWFTPSLH